MLIRTKNTKANMNKPQSLKYKIEANVACLALLFCVGSTSAQLTVTTDNQQQISLPFTPSWIPALDSLIAGLAPSSSSGNFSLDRAGSSVNSLTSEGSLTISQLPGNNTSTNYVT